MILQNKHQLLDRVPLALADLIGIAPDQLRQDERKQMSRDIGPDLVLHWGPYRFMFEVKYSSSAGTVALAVRQVQIYARDYGSDVVPVVAVPYMSEFGRRLCEEAGVGWLDLSGNGAIVASGLRVRVEGRTSQFKRVGRPPSLFAPKSSRIVRWLLMNPKQSWTQRAIAQATGIDEGHLSRIVARMEDQMFLVRDGSGALRVRDPNLLLDAWREAYHFDRHELVKGHIPARSSETLLHDLSRKLGDLGVKYAASGLAGAWLINRFAGFRLVTVYVQHVVPDDALVDLGWRREERGANVWLVVPNDDGVFQGAVERDDVWCVHPVQVYLDLKGHPERAREAADRLRADTLNLEPE